MVDVAFVVEAFVAVRLPSVVSPVTFNVEDNVAAAVAASVPTLALCENKFVDDAVVEKKLVVVALVAKSELSVPTAVRFGAESSVPMLDVALIRASARALVK